MKGVVRIERHDLGPRLHVLGRRIHEYHAGLATLGTLPLVSLGGYHPVRWSVLVALGGLWLVVKDWPDLFPTTRDRASWRLGIHRLPPRERLAFVYAECGREDSNLQGPKPNGT